MQNFNKTYKSRSNPSKLNPYTPAYNGPKIIKRQQSGFLTRSLSNHKKFGIRQINVSPVSHTSKQKKKNLQLTITKVNTINLTNLTYDKKIKLLHSPKTQPSTSKVQKNNYFKSNNINKIVQKMNGNHSQAQIKRPQHQSNPFKFQPIKKLAKGQYGSIYLAVSEETKFMAVLKCFDKTKVAIQFLIDELKIQMYCRHPHILPGYGFFFGRGQVYLIMEAGTHNLYSQIKKEGFFTEKKAATYIHQIMKGLSFLHLNGIIHRDLKPENIIVCGSTLKISDFGWSIITQTQRTTYCGTMEYVSPEVSMGKPYDFKIDSWSIGVLTYQMLTGFPPFEVNTASQRDHPKLDYKEVKFPFTVTDLARKFICKMLHFDPKKRSSIAEALRDEWLAMNSEQFHTNSQKNCFTRYQNEI